MIPAALAALLLLQIPPGAAVTPLEDSIFFDAGGSDIGVIVMEAGAAEALVAERAARTTTMLGYRTAVIEETSADGRPRRHLLLDFGDDWLAISATRRTDEENAGDAAPADGQTGPDPIEIVRKILRPGPDAGRYPVSIALWIDGYLVDDAAGHVPLGFFEGPVVVEVRSAGDR